MSFWTSIRAVGAGGGGGGGAVTKQTVAVPDFIYPRGKITRVTQASKNARATTQAQRYSLYPQSNKQLSLLPTPEIRALVTAGLAGFQPADFRMDKQGFVRITKSAMRDSRDQMGAQHGMYLRYAAGRFLQAAKAVRQALNMLSTSANKWQENIDQRSTQVAQLRKIVTTGRNRAAKMLDNDYYDALLDGRQNFQDFNIRASGNAGAAFNMFVRDPQPQNYMNFMKALGRRTTAYNAVQGQPLVRAAMTGLQAEGVQNWVDVSRIGAVNTSILERGDFPVPYQASGGRGISFLRRFGDPIVGAALINPMAPAPAPVIVNNPPQQNIFNESFYANLPDFPSMVLPPGINEADDSMNLSAISQRSAMNLGPFTSLPPGGRFTSTSQILPGQNPRRSQRIATRKKLNLGAQRFQG